MALEIKHRSQLGDPGTKSVEPQRETTGTNETGEPTGAAKSTLVRETVDDSHLGEPTGTAEPKRSETFESPVGHIRRKQVKEPENKAVKSTSKKTAKKTARKK